MQKKRLLLHVCCGPCATHSVKQLKEEYEVVMYWYNPNIHPYGEYFKRFLDGEKVSERLGVEMVEGEYDVESWIDKIKGYEQEPEGGKRCTLCFLQRLERTIEYAKEKRFDCVTTTLTISPHKDADMINKIGRKLCERQGIGWVESNFKKQDGFNKSVKMSKEMGLYRQDFCGCFYSRRPTFLK